MKKISSLQLCFALVGTFLGAGFVSGQELWQFFACFGTPGLFGFVLSAIVLIAAHAALLILIRTTKEERIDRLLTYGNYPALRFALMGLQYLFLFGVIVIMVAGAAANLEELLGISQTAGAFLVALLVLLLALCGLHSLVAAFSVIVPFITVCAVLIAIRIISVKSGFNAALPTAVTSTLRPTWYVSSLTYTSYNLFGTLSTMIPFASAIPNNRVLRRGLLGGGAILLAIAMSMIAAMLVFPASGQSELPMLCLAGEISPVLATAYSILMTLSMISAALGCVFALLRQLQLQLPTLQKNGSLLIILLCICAFFLSRFGFGALIGSFYPVCGYLGIPFIVMLFLNWCRIQKKETAMTRRRVHKTSTALFRTDTKCGTAFQAESRPASHLISLPGIQ